MYKLLTGVVVSLLMEKTVVVEVTEQKPHPMYRKLQKRSKRFKADVNEQSLSLGDVVEITGTRPMAKDKHFKVTAIVRKSTRQEAVKEEGE